MPGLKTLKLKKIFIKTTEWCLPKNNSATAARKAVFYMNNLSISILGDIFKGNYIYAIITIVARMFVVFCCLPVHELAHGWAAYKQGDDTAKKLGRLSFNPFSHLDPIGTIMIFLFGIGYAKPVPINPLKFKNYRKGVALTALAGPLSNLVMSFIFAFIGSGLNRLAGANTAMQLLVLFFGFAANINIALAVFNLLPIPPLDGSRVLAVILPDRAYEKYFRYERYIMIALMVLLFTGVLDTPLALLNNLFHKFIYFLPNLVFGN
jgi:hypothetical protein